MNNQQEIDLLQTVPLPVPKLQGKAHKKRRHLVVGITLLVTTSLLLIFAQVFIDWGRAAPSTSQTQRTEILRSMRPSVQESKPGAGIASRADNLLENLVAHQQFSGTVLIAQGSNVLLSKGYSMADWDAQVPNTPQTKFYLGSTTKQFTAMAILILQEQGKLHVGDDLCAYIQSCPAAWQPVTIQETLTHTSGIPELDDSQMSDTSPQAWIDSYDDVPLVFTPGSQYSYCSLCYQILGYIIQQASGEPYSKFLQQAIFSPLEMNDTDFDPDYLSLPDHAVGYAIWQVQDVPLSEPTDPQWSFLSASGLLHTTVGDMYRWDQALYTHSLVSQESLDQAFTPYIAAQYAGSSYGDGWFISKSPIPGHRLIWHDGKINGFRTYIGRYIDDQVTIIILSNLAALDELSLAHQFEQIIFGQPESHA